MILETREDWLQHVIKPAVASGSMIPIVRRHGIYLSAFSGDGKRFARLFAETWQRIPLCSRRAMLRHWRNRESDPVWQRPFSPTIELLDDWRSRADTHNGHFLRFCAPIVDAVPEDVACDLIAHELAHVVQSAIGIREGTEGEDGSRRWFNAKGEYWGDADDIEEHADELVEAWGLEVESSDQWSLEAGVVKTRGVTLKDYIAHYAEFHRMGKR